MKPLVLWLTMLAVISLYPFHSTPSISYADKVLHFLLYAITCALFYSVIRTSSRNERLRKGALPLVLSFVLASAFGLAMEVAQHFAGTRSFSLWDQAANTLGALAAVVYIRFVAARKRPAR